MMIDYNIINKSIQHYEKYKFQRIETPWLVSQAIDNITRPKDKQPMIVEYNQKALVASGEQSFLYLYLKGFLPKGQYQTITPCFRVESFDFLHSKYFIKNELIKTDIISQFELYKVMYTAKKFYEELFKDKIVIKKTDEGFDLEYKDHELGSYGIRECEFLTWIYGTGCAEPRTSKIMKLYGLSY